MRLILVAIVILLAGCVNTDVSLTPKSTAGANITTACAVDADCAAAQCCHPVSVVNKNFAPDCSEAICTMDCKPNTVDCGQGEFKCISGQCVTIINAPL